MALRIVFAKCGRPIAGGGTPWWNPSDARAGRSHRRKPRCLPGRRCQRLSVRSAACSLRRCWSKSLAWWSPPGSASANTVKATYASLWSKTSNGSARPRAACAASLKAASKRCTTWFLSPTGDRHDPGTHVLGHGPGTLQVSGSDHAPQKPFRQVRFVMVAPLKVGIAGLGTVGAEVVRLIESQGGALTARCGRPVRVVAVTARSKAKKRGLDLRGVAWVKNPLALAESPDIDCLVELIGGAGDPAFSAIETALKSGKSVVTANKALIARHGLRLAKAAEKHGGALNYEAAVAGAIPVVKTLREGLAGTAISRVYGILNGTCNYILTRMEQEGLSFQDCLKDAQRLGYAEANPSFDVDGHDAAQK